MDPRLQALADRLQRISDEQVDFLAVMGKRAGLLNQGHRGYTPMCSM